MHDVLVVGAGVAGLQCARRLRASGARVLVVDRAAKPGGRCATRSFGELPVDYGPLFLHGSDPEFLEALQQVPGVGLLPGWPLRVSGEGTPCLPAAFAPGERRLAFREGLNVFPRALAEGLEIRLNTRITAVHAERGVLTLESEEGERLGCREVVLALALEQSLPLVRMLPSGRERDGALALLDMFASLPCLTVIAGYRETRRTPEWDLLYPEDHSALLLVGNESSKRPQSAETCLVYQAAPSWSHARRDQPREQWSPELLGEAATLLGAWAGQPDWIQAHRWRYARLGPPDHLSAPLRVSGPWGALGLAGDLFDPVGGVQAAWRSGERLARRILGEPLP
ncbi:MAG: FAD-dependent oxidoreductase [Spirochaetales bacterium]|nr:FAD-dependent oxidoreductase [Spirochaetales bacterium]